jgi:hypothetical protein
MQATMTKRFFPKAAQLLIALVLLQAAWYLLRAGMALRFWKTLNQYQPRGGALYLFISGAAWGVAGVFTGAALWLRKAWAWGAATGYFLAAELWFWFDRLALQQAHANNLFVLVLHISILSLLALLLFSPTVRNFYHGRR